MIPGDSLTLANPVRVLRNAVLFCSPSYVSGHRVRFVSGHGFGGAQQASLQLDGGELRNNGYMEFAAHPTLITHAPGATFCLVQLSTTANQRVRCPLPVRCVPTACVCSRRFSMSDACCFTLFGSVWCPCTQFVVKGTLTFGPSNPCSFVTANKNIILLDGLERPAHLELRTKTTITGESSVLIAIIALPATAHRICAHMPVLLCL